MAPSHDPTYPLFSIMSFMGFALSAVPFSWHLQAWNSGTCAFMAWTGLACLNGFVNSIIWKGSLRNSAPVWCDISSKIIIGASIGIPASTLCISRRLYSLTSVTTVSVTRADKRRMVLIDLCISLGIPAIIMVLHYVVQGHRFDIFEDVGCYPVVYNTLPAYFLYAAWPVALGIVSFVFSCLTLRSFWLRRAQFNQLMSSNTAMSMSRYLRLMILAMADIMFTIPISSYVMYMGTKGIPLEPWVSWEETHYNFSRVGLVPALFWRNGPGQGIPIELTRWLPVVCSFLFFALFGFASEAQKQYKRVFWGALEPFGLKPAPSKPLKNKVALPSWVKPFKTGTSASPASSSPPSATKPQKAYTGELTSYTSTDIELSTCVGSDIEKSACRTSYSSLETAPPAYSHSKPHIPTRPVPLNLPLDVEIDVEKAFPSSPFSESATTVLGSEDEKTPKKFDLLFSITVDKDADVESGLPSPSFSVASSSASTSRHHRECSPTPPLPILNTTTIDIVSPTPRQGLQVQQSHTSLNTLNSRDRIYVVNGLDRLPSPPPFSNVFDGDRPLHPGFHRPFSPPATYPATIPHPEAVVGYVDGIRVTVQTHSSSSEDLSLGANERSAA